MESVTHDDPSALGPGEIWTIGHWTCSEAEFVDTLRRAGIELVVDIRAQPGSRRSPQFGADAMPAWLAAAGIAYEHLPELGGRRGKQAVDPAVNSGWRNESFKNYADYTLTAPFEVGLARLADLARDRRVAVMCGEPMPWRCHRLLVANVLTARGWRVWHLTTNAAPRPHELGQWGAPAYADSGGVVTYPGVDPPAAGSPAEGSQRPGRQLEEVDEGLSR